MLFFKKNNNKEQETDKFYSGVIKRSKSLVGNTELDNPTTKKQTLIDKLDLKEKFNFIDMGVNIKFKKEDSSSNPPEFKVPKQATAPRSNSFHEIKDDEKSSKLMPK